MSNRSPVPRHPGRRRALAARGVFVVAGLLVVAAIWSMWYDWFLCVGSWRVGVQRSTLQVMRGGPAIQTTVRTAGPSSGPRPVYWLTQNNFARSDGISAGVVAFCPSLMGVTYGWNCVVALWPASALLAAAGGAMLWWSFGPAQRRARGRCQSCGYDLSGLASGGNCPECGKATVARV